MHDAGAVGRLDFEHVVETLSGALGSMRGQAPILVFHHVGRGKVGEPLLRAIAKSLLLFLQSLLLLSLMLLPLLQLLLLG